MKKRLLKKIIVWLLRRYFPEYQLVLENDLVNISAGILDPCLGCTFTNHCDHCPAHGAHRAARRLIDKCLHDKQQKYFRSKGPGDHQTANSKDSPRNISPGPGKEE